MDDYYDTLNHIIYLNLTDNKDKMWHVSKHKLPVYLAAHHSVMFAKTNDIYFFGGSDIWEGDQFNYNFKMCIDDDNFEWNKWERIIWIAFYKNVQNKQCLIALLPKDVVKHVVAFLKRPLSLFDC